MPSLCAKPVESQGGGAAEGRNNAPSPPPETMLNQALAIIEKKVRNLEKRKVSFCLANFYCSLLSKHCWEQNVGILPIEFYIIDVLIS